MKKNINEPFILSLEAQDQIRDAKKIIKTILEIDVNSSMKKKVIDQMIWNITGANGKYRTRYQSKKTVFGNPSSINHEHVYTRKLLILRILKNPSNVDEILEDAIGCVVTKEEHDKLTLIDKNNQTIHGWERYKAAGIKVWDLEKNKLKQF